MKNLELLTVIDDLCFFIDHIQSEIFLENYVSPIPNAKTYVFNSLIPIRKQICRIRKSIASKPLALYDKANMMDLNAISELKMRVLAMFDGAKFTPKQKNEQGEQAFQNENP